MSDDHIISEIESSMGGPSHEVMALGSAYLAAPQKRSGILDLGCGDGRNAFMLSGSGMLVTAVDISSASIRRLQNLATHYSRDIEISVSNVANFKFERTYESILAHGILHFLDSHDIESLVYRMKRHTRPGGYNMITISPFASDHEIIEGFRAQGHKNALRQGELLRHYLDWETVSHETYTKWDYHPGVGAHSHPIEKFVLRKPHSEEVPLLASLRMDLTANDLEERVGKAIREQSPIGLTKNEVVSALGIPQRMFRYSAEGPQFSFRGFCEDGYRLELMFYGRYAMYVSNDVVSGFSVFQSHFCALQPRAALLANCESVLEANAGKWRVQPERFGFVGLRGSLCHTR